MAAAEFELADIVANTARLALMGNLQFQGWSKLGELLFYWKDTSIQFVGLGIPQSVDMRSLPYYQTLKHIHQSSRSAF